MALLTIVDKIHCYNIIIVSKGEALRDFLLRKIPHAICIIFVRVNFVYKLFMLHVAAEVNACQH